MRVLLICRMRFHVSETIFSRGSFVFLPLFPSFFLALLIHFGANQIDVRKGKKRPGQETGLGDRGQLNVLNDTKLVLNEHE